MSLGARSRRRGASVLQQVLLLTLLVLLGYLVVTRWLPPELVDCLTREPEPCVSMERLAALEGERDSLAEAVDALKQDQIALERAQQMDREANRIAREQLLLEQNQRLKLDKQVSFLKRLIREGGGGLLEVKDVRIAPMDGGTYEYTFTVSQVIQDFGWSEGRVLVKVSGQSETGPATLSLGELPYAEPSEHRMRFKHFEGFGGRLALPEGFEPEHLVVEIEPADDKLIPVNEAFAWPR